MNRQYGQKLRKVPSSIQLQRVLHAHSRRSKVCSTRCLRSVDIDLRELQTDRQGDTRQTGREIRDRQAGRQADRQTEADRQTDRQAGGQADRQAGRDRKTKRPEKEGKRNA